MKNIETYWKILKKPNWVRPLQTLPATFSKNCINQQRSCHLVEALQQNGVFVQNQNSEALPAFEGRWVKIRDKAREMRIILSSTPPTALVRRSTHAPTPSPSSLPQSSSFLKSLSMSSQKSISSPKESNFRDLLFPCAYLSHNPVFYISWPDVWNRSVFFLLIKYITSPSPTRCRSLQSAPI